VSLFVGLAVLAMGATAQAAIISINICDGENPEWMSASVDPVGSGTLTIVQETPNAPGYVTWVFPHDVVSMFNHDYNIGRGETPTGYDPQYTSDALQVAGDCYLDQVYVYFYSGNTNEDPQYAIPNAPNLPEEGTVDIHLDGGDTLRIHYNSAPETSTFALLGIGVFGLVAYSWRHRRN
jgi:hypothetical protein